MTHKEMLEVWSIALSLKPCQHETWYGIPEVDAWCSNCKMDEFEVGIEDDTLWQEALNIYFNT